MAELFAVVPQGLEAVAVAEIIEKLQPIDWCRSYEERGAVVFKTGAAPSTWFSLRSADNVFALVLESESVDPTPTGLVQAERWATDADYSAALAVWKQCLEFIPPKLDGSAIDTQNPKFRATADREGKHSYHGPEYAAEIGAGVITKLGWKVDLKSFDIEFYAHVNGLLLLYGISLTRRLKVDLFKRHRDALVRTTLKSSIAFSVARVLRVSDFDFVLDPMCGAGTIPIEISQAWKSLCLGGDIDTDAVSASSANSRSSRPGVPPDTVLWNSTRLPLRPSIFDHVICDLPYGRRCGSHRDNMRVYARALSEVSRVLRPGGSALMMTIEHRLIAACLEQNCAPRLRITACHGMDNSGHWVGLYVFNKDGDGVSRPSPNP